MYEMSAPGYYDGSIEDPAEENIAFQEWGKQLRAQWSWQWELPFEIDLQEVLSIYEQEIVRSADGRIKNGAGMWKLTGEDAPYVQPDVETRQAKL